MYSKKTFTLKKLVLALALAGYTLGGAYAALTPPTGSIQGTAPVLSAPSKNDNPAHTVDLSSSATGDKLATGDTITLSYKYTDTDGDADDSTSTVHWYYVKGDVDTEITGGIVNTPASESGTGTSIMTIPGAAVGAERIKVVIQEYSLTGDPRAGTTITVNDTSGGDGGGSVTPPGPVEPGEGGNNGLTPGIYLSTDTGFTNNLIGSETKLDVGKTYVFKLWDSEAVGTTDLTDSVNYNWRLTGTSATTNTVAPEGGIVTPTSNGNFTVPANTAGREITGSDDGVQGFNLAVDYQ